MNWSLLKDVYGLELSLRDTVSRVDASEIHVAYFHLFQAFQLYKILFLSISMFQMYLYFVSLEWHLPG